nr:NADH dehydrogenase subunit 4 [Uniformus sp.]
MKFIFYCFFLIPLIMLEFNWYLMQFSFSLFLLLMMVVYCSNFFSLISYMFFIDFYSFGLIFLTILIIYLMLVSSSKCFKFMNSEFLMINIMLMIVLLVIFSVYNMFIMYMFFELSLVPLMILIYGWGYQPERLLSGLYLFFYTLLASLPLLVLLMYIYSTKFSLVFNLSYLFPMNFFLHLSMMLAFLVKLPMFMFHYWLPKAHVQAPISGSMILAGLLLKIGGYGIFRFMYLFEFIFLKYSYIWFSLCLMGSVLVSLICFMQVDLKSMIAYSSVAHMGLCLGGLLTMSYTGVMGSYLMMISHGICSSALFCLGNISYERLSTRSFYLNKGLISIMPSLSFYWFMFSMFNMGCPPSINFFSEILILMSMVNYSFYSPIVFFFISMFCAFFCFYLFSYSQHGQFNYLYSNSLILIREYFLLSIHISPMLGLVFIMNNLFY